MSQILDDIRGVFRRKDDMLTQLIVINIVVFLLINIVGVFLFLASVDATSKVEVGNFLSTNLMLSSDIIKFLTHPWTLITYFFTHEGISHIFFNLLFLFWFGQLIQEYIGSNRLLSLYVLGGIGGGLLYLAAYNTIPVFAEAKGSVLLGASGACYAVVVGAATLLPNYCFSLLFIGSVRIVYIAAAYVLFSFIEIKSGNPGGNIAHLGGAMVGYLFVTQLRQGRDLGTPIIYIFNTLRGFFNPKKKLTVSYTAKRTYEPVSSNPSRAAKTQQTSAKSTSTIQQEEVDAILDKMLVSGYNSLTLEEKRKLDAAGEGGNPSN